MAAVEEVLPDVADQPLDLALGLGPVRAARPDAEAPVQGEAQELRVLDQPPALLAPVLDDDRLHLVEQELRRHTAEVAERRVQPPHHHRPRLTLVVLYPHQPRVAQHHDQRVPLAPGQPELREVHLRDPDGQKRAADAERLERAHPLRLGREPGPARMLDHVVEREQAAHHHLGRGDPAVADVLGTERPVDPARADPADLQVPDRLLGHQPSLRQGLHEPEHLEPAGPEPIRELRAGEHAAVQARQRDPLGPAARQAEGFECPLAALQVGDHRQSPSFEPSWLGEPPRLGTRRHRGTLLGETSNCFVTISMHVKPNTVSARRGKGVGNRPFPTSRRGNGLPDRGSATRRQ